MFCHHHFNVAQKLCHMMQLLTCLQDSSYLCNFTYLLRCIAIFKWLIIISLTSSQWYMDAYRWNWAEMRAVSYITIYSQSRSEYFFSQSHLVKIKFACHHFSPHYQLLLEFTLQTICLCKEAFYTAENSLYNIIR